MPLYRTTKLVNATQFNKMGDNPAVCEEVDRALDGMPLEPSYYIPARGKGFGGDREVLIGDFIVEVEHWDGNPDYEVWRKEDFLRTHMLAYEQESKPRGAADNMPDRNKFVAVISKEYGPFVACDFDYRFWHTGSVIGGWMNRTPVRKTDTWMYLNDLDNKPYRWRTLGSDELDKERQLTVPMQPELERMCLE